MFDGYVGVLAEELRERVRSLSPTQLEDFGECPQKFLLKHILGVQDVDHPERELQISTRDKGIIDHRILERFYRSMNADELASAAVTLPRLPDPRSRGSRRWSTSTSTSSSPRPRLQRHGARHRAARHASASCATSWPSTWPTSTASGLVPAQVRVPLRVAASRAGGSSRAVRHRDGRRPGPGRRDRSIASTPAAAVFRIVDYKSGKAARHVNLGDKIDRGVRLQLRALRHGRVASSSSRRPRTVSGTIKPIVVGEEGRQVHLRARRRNGSGSCATLEIFIGAILRGRFPAFPNENDEDFNSCKYCPVNHSCRTRHDPAEKYAVQQSHDPRTLLGGESGERGQQQSFDVRAPRRATHPTPESGHRGGCRNRQDHRDRRPRCFELMLEREELQPERIVLMTFTEKAAGEIADRIRAALGRSLGEPGGRARAKLAWPAGSPNPLLPSPTARRRAGSSPGTSSSVDAFRSQTIHSFCQSLLRSFRSRRGSIRSSRSSRASSARCSTPSCTTPGSTRRRARTRRRRSRARVGDAVRVRRLPLPHPAHGLRPHRAARPAGRDGIRLR